MGVNKINAHGICGGKWRYQMHEVRKNEIAPVDVCFGYSSSISTDGNKQREREQEIWNWKYESIKAIGNKEF